MHTHQVERVEREAVNLVGFEITESLNNVLETKIVGTLREELAARKDEIEGVAGSGVYLVQIYPEDGHWTPDKPFRQVIALEAVSPGALPEGMIVHTLPSGPYVKITHQGPESRIADTYDYINRTLGHRPVDIEYWHDIHGLEREDSVIEIYIPGKA